jgi:dihydroflavonol-4-reductase
VWEVNFVGAANVLSAAHLTGVEKVIYTASIFTLGVGVNGQPVAEDVEDNLRRLKFTYIAARRAAQAKAEKFAATGMPIVYVYPTYCLGPGLHNVNAPPQRQIIAYLRGGLPFCPSGGLNIVDARDVGEAHVLALDKGISWAARMSQSVSCLRGWARPPTAGCWSCRRRAGLSAWADGSCSGSPARR